MSRQSQWLGMDDSHLVAIADKHFLRPEVAQAFTRMQAAAQTDGVDMQIVSSYRSFERQLAIWNAKWRGERPLYDINNVLLDPSLLSDEEKMHAILTWSALPGASRHHWGTDLDVYDKRRVEASGSPFELVPQEYCDDGPCAALADWLQRYASDFGFFLPYATYVGGVAEEPWHLSYRVSADKITEELALDALAATLIQSDLEGKSVILANLPEIFHRYTLNQGVSP